MTPISTQKEPSLFQLYLKVNRFKFHFWSFPSKISKVGLFVKKKATFWFVPGWWISVKPPRAVKVLFPDGLGLGYFSWTETDSNRWRLGTCEEKEMVPSMSITVPQAYLRIFSAGRWDVSRRTRSAAKKALSIQPTRPQEVRIDVGCICNFWTK